MRNIHAPILYAEDNLMDIELTKEAYASLQLQNPLEIVRDGRELMDFLHCEGAYADRYPDMPILILLDNKMPRITGLEVLKQLKSHPKFKHIPVVMMTSSSLDSDIRRGYELGANAYVMKAVDFDELQECLADILQFWVKRNYTIHL